MTIKLSEKLYPKEAIIKASYFFTDKYFLYLDSDDKYYYIDIKPKNGNLENNIENEFLNEVLIQTTRYNIMTQTKNIRELIIGRALASTVIDNTDTGFVDDEAIDSEEILHSWFDKDDK